ncbi:MAG: membrane dipeptidase, partial [Rhodopirellula sp.]|nr:membrane dipeptidase [Rhodopirellula sp.]
KPGWVRFVSDPQTVGMSDIVDHIDHICQLAGNAKHCGIGTDLDGGFGKEQVPRDLTSIADLQQMATLLSDRGYSDDDVEGIMNRNWLDFFRRVWA